MVLNCIIVDDDLMVWKGLERFCDKLELFNMIGICENVKKVFEFFFKEVVDFIFLDIEMLEIMGIEFLENVVFLF